MAQLFSPSAAPLVACFPLWTFRAEAAQRFSRQGEMYSFTKLLPQASKLLRLPRTTALCRGSRCPDRKGPLREKPRRSGRQKGLSPSGEQTGRPGDLIQQKETFS
ncbi:hypothetical protein NWE48_23795 [Escherichia coli]|nr:hypothetical protein [Escherichia coli]